MSFTSFSWNYSWIFTALVLPAVLIGFLIWMFISSINKLIFHEANLTRKYYIDQDIKINDAYFECLDKKNKILSALWLGSLISSIVWIIISLFFTITNIILLTTTNEIKTFMAASKSIFDNTYVIKTFAEFLILLISIIALIIISFSFSKYVLLNKFIKKWKEENSNKSFLKENKENPNLNQNILENASKVVFKINKSDLSISLNPFKKDIKTTNNPIGLISFYSLISYCDEVYINGETYNFETYVTNLWDYAYKHNKNLN
ncbi:hypothetical protein [Mycoplasmopsis felifaucium]|uniref:hypothetical protein n=1 Tax=Mycoplasmopsis felifaucium TaxID=35768 RepID=UPI00048482F1|nr:hypothetical protein [Mycoplasmopsis felifaucium]